MKIHNNVSDCEIGKRTNEYMKSRQKIQKAATTKRARSLEHLLSLA